MKQWTTKDLMRILKNNNFVFVRQNGSHRIYKDNTGKEIVVKDKMKSVIIQRLIKENKLKEV